MDGARHVIKRISNPSFLSQLTSYDVARTIHLSLRAGGGRLKRSTVAWMTHR